MGGVGRMRFLTRMMQYFALLFTQTTFRIMNVLLRQIRCDSRAHGMLMETFLLALSILKPRPHRRVENRHEEHCQ